MCHNAKWLERSVSNDHQRLGCKDKVQFPLAMEIQSPGAPWGESFWTKMACVLGHLGTNIICQVSIAKMYIYRNTCNTHKIYCRDFWRVKHVKWPRFPFNTATSDHSRCNLCCIHRKHLYFPAYVWYHSHVSKFHIISNNMFTPLHLHQTPLLR